MEGLEEFLFESWFLEEGTVVTFLDVVKNLEVLSFINFRKFINL